MADATQLAAEDAASIALLEQLRQRLGVTQLSPAQREALESPGQYSAAEFSPVEAEILLRLVALAGVEWPAAQSPPHKQLGWAVEQARKELARGVQPFWGRSWVFAVLAAGLAAWALFDAVPIWLVLASLVLAALTIPLAQRVAVERRNTLQLVESELPRRNILERLGENDPSLFAILDSMPAPVRWLRLGWPSQSLRDRVQLVARNLDWYLRPPAPYLRWNWFTFTAGPAWVVYLLFLLPQWVVRLLESHGMHGYMGVAVLSLLPLIACWQPDRVGLRRYFADALALHMRQRVAERALLNKHEAAEPAQPSA